MAIPGSVRDSSKRPHCRNVPRSICCFWSDIHERRQGIIDEIQRGMGEVCSKQPSDVTGGEGVFEQLYISNKILV